MSKFGKVEELAELLHKTLQWHCDNPRRLVPSGTPPSVETLTEIFSILFFASLKTEEGRSIQVRVYFVDPNDPDPAAPPTIRSDRWRTFPLSKRIPLTVQNLAKFAKAADPWATGIAIHHNDSEGLFIWGIVDQVLHLSTSIVRETLGTYIQAGFFHAVINGPADIIVMVGATFVGRLAQDSIFRRQNDCLSTGPVHDLIKGWVKPMWGRVFRKCAKLGPVTNRALWKEILLDEWIRTVSRILINIQRQRHGGALLFVGDSKLTDLRVKYSIDYDRLYEGLHLGLHHKIRSEEFDSERESYLKQRNGQLPVDLYWKLEISESDEEDCTGMMTGAVRTVSSFSGVDGAIVLSKDLVALGFGCIITTEDTALQIHISEDEEADVTRTVSFESFGTRHGSMIRYCNKHPGALGFVVSQDGDIRAITRLGDKCVVFDNVKVHDFYRDPTPESIEAKVKTT